MTVDKEVTYNDVTPKYLYALWTPDLPASTSQDRGLQVCTLLHLASRMRKSGVSTITEGASAFLSSWLKRQRLLLLRASLGHGVAAARARDQTARVEYLQVLPCSTQGKGLQDTA